MSKTKSIIRISENFTIRKIDPKLLACNFFKGEYSNRTLPENKIKSSHASIKMGKDVGYKSTAEVFQFKDKNNNYQTIYTTNHASYDYFSGNIDEKPLLRCKYCKRGNLKNSIGLPISMEIQNNNNIIFYVIDTFCDFGCAFSFLKRKNSENRLFRNSLYMNAEQMLYCFYYRVFPDKIGEKIKEKPDWDLLRENGGSLTNEEFDSDATEYVLVPSLIMLPSKKQYIKLNTKNN
jgi:uncharacterized protein YutD